MKKETPSFEKKLEKNIWENNLKEVLTFILKAVKIPFYRKGATWSWLKNSNCKYVEIRIDMRDGGFIIKNRHGDRISLEDLKKQ